VIIGAHIVKWSTSVLTLILLTGSVGLNVFLAKRVETLGNAISTLKNERRLQVGSVVPELVADGPSATRLAIPINGPVPTVLYVFTPTCGWCERNLDNIRALRSQSTGRYEFIGVSLTPDGLDDYLKRAELGMRIVIGDDGFRRLYKIASTPTTIVVSAQGKVEGVWAGAYQKDLGKAVEQFFMARLPGLRSFQPVSAPIKQ
jgi:hypothetical protein